VAREASPCPIGRQAKELLVDVAARKVSSALIPRSELEEVAERTKAVKVRFLELARVP
jgi:hypothetical protein